MRRLISTLLIIIMQNQQQYEDLFNYLVDRNIPSDVAAETANIVASNRDRTPEENQKVRNVWTILSTLESFRGE